MAESTLSLAYNDLAGEVGNFLGFGRGANNADTPWTAQQQNRIDSCVKSGISRVIYPDPVEGQTVGHSWSFMHPTTTLQLVINQNFITLPDDFGGFEGEVYLAPLNNRTWFPIKLYNEGMLNAAYSQTPTLSSRPQMVAVQWIKGSTGMAMQRANLFVYPLPDQAYTIQFSYYFHPDYLNAAFPFPPGGAHIADLYKEAVLAAAEQLMDDMAGIHSQRFNTRLMAAISMDQRSKAISLGVNWDRSDGQDLMNWRFNHGLSPITIQGITPA